MTLTIDPIACIDDASLARMTDRAYRDAARAWRDFSATPSRDRRAAALASDEARSADDYYRHLRAELDRRAAS